MIAREATTSSPSASWPRPLACGFLSSRHDPPPQSRHRPTARAHGSARWRLQAARSCAPCDSTAQASTPACIARACLLGPHSGVYRADGRGIPATKEPRVHVVADPFSHLVRHSNLERAFSSVCLEPAHSAQRSQTSRWQHAKPRRAARSSSARLHRCRLRLLVEQALPPLRPPPAGLTRASAPRRLQGRSSRSRVRRETQQRRHTSLACIARACLLPSRARVPVPCYHGQRATCPS